MKERDAVQCDYDAMKLEVGELRQLMLKQQNLVDLVGRKKVGKGATSKNEMREARLEKVRQRAREQMKLDTSVLAEKIDKERGGREDMEREREREQEKQANTAQLETLKKLEERLTKAEVNGDRLQIMLKAEQDKSQYQHELLLMQQQQMQQNFVAAPAAAQQPQIIYQQVALPQQQYGQGGRDGRDGQGGQLVRGKVGEAVPLEPPKRRATKFTDEVVVKDTAIGEKEPSSSWEKEYHDFILEKEEEQASQQAAVLEQQAASKLELERAEQRLAATNFEAEQEKERKRLKEEAEVRAL